MPADHLPGGLEQERPENIAGSVDSRLASHDAEIKALWENVRKLHGRTRHMEKLFDTLNSAVWKRLVFRIDGWGPWHRIRQTPRWRPWHGRWRS